MSDFPALGGNSSSRDGIGGGGSSGGGGGPTSSLLSFSSIAGGRGPAGADALRNGPSNPAPTAADFTIDDFPALTPGASGLSNQQHQPPSQLHHMQQQQQQLSQHLSLQHQQDQQQAHLLNRSNTGTPGRADGLSNGLADPTINGPAGISPLGPGTAFGGPSVLAMPTQPSRAGSASSGVGNSSSTPASGGKRPIGPGSMYAMKPQPNNFDAPSSGSSTPTDLTMTPLGGPTPIPPAGTTDKYGLYGLIDLIRLTDPDANMIHLGCDLTSLGLDLATNDPLYSTFMSPFSEYPTLGSEPQFTLPSCYNLLQPPPPPMTKVSSFSDETLFYIFYAQPRESLQEAAAQELFNRSWRFHKELKLWVSRDRSPESLAAEAAISTKGAGFERGIFIFFDPGVWARVKKEWVVYYDQLEERGILGGVPEGSNGMTTNNNGDSETPGSVTGASVQQNARTGGFGDDGGLQRGGSESTRSGWTPQSQQQGFYGSGLPPLGLPAEGSGSSAVNAGR